MAVTVILAGSAHTFDWYCRKVICVNPRDRSVIYADRPETLRGRMLTSEDRVVELGDFWKRPTHQQVGIYETLETRYSPTDPPRIEYVEDF